MWWLESQNNFEKVEQIKWSDLKTYHKAIVIKIVWYCYKDRYIDQWTK